MKSPVKRMCRLPYGVNWDRGGTIMPPPFHDVQIGGSSARYPVATEMLLRECLRQGIKVSLVRRS